MIKINNKNEIDNILFNFPNFELCYEKIIHNKVYNKEYNLAIPKGKNTMLWFTTYKNENICYLLELNNNKKIINIYIVLVSFSNYLCSQDGTI
jgi:hypothetical protein